MEFVTNEKLTIVGAAGMIGSNMAQTASMMGLTPNISLPAIVACRFFTSNILLLKKCVQNIGT